MREPPLALRKTGGEVGGASPMLGSQAPPPSDRIELNGVSFPSRAAARMLETNRAFPLNSGGSERWPCRRNVQRSHGTAKTYAATSITMAVPQTRLVIIKVISGIPSIAAKARVGSTATKKKATRPMRRWVALFVDTALADGAVPWLRHDT